MVYKIFAYRRVIFYNINIIFFKQDTRTNTGCLKDMRPEANGWLNYRDVNWSHAFAIVDFYNKGLFTVHIVQIINGKTSLWGELIEG